MTGTKAPPKGITPIVSIIILLLITVALAGAAYSFIMMHWTSVTGKNIIILGQYCTESADGKLANIVVQSTGTETILLDEISVYNTGTLAFITANYGNVRWTKTTDEEIITELEPGEKGRLIIPCEEYCTYRFIHAGSLGSSTQTVSVAC